ncbi:neutral/alkaline non-lysosomal ceramidase N-terminal domain-containing protein [Microlunatus sp. GCM10028923]|uniref:neutral/alkaline non-lysosomal ceramidase N-terminal domain-containing protein n=1 Tax=Microlunatus sp. GCM10028923 TaxID=3273400 RepID=UPI0036210F56
MTSTTLGAATADITPRHPVDLSGFASRTEPMTGVRAPLELQAFAFGDDGGLRAVLVAADLLWWGPDVAEALRARIAAEHGIGAEAVLLHASHTHSGPQPGLTFSTLVGRGDRDYLDFLATTTLEAVAAAVADREPVTVARGSGSCSIALNRRRADPDGGRGGPDPDGPVDPEVTVIRFDRPDGSAKALLTHYACHPVITADQLAGPDFPGVTRARLAERLGPLRQAQDDASTGSGKTVVIAFLQGCCGDLDPALTEGDRFVRGGDADLDRLGGALADSVIAVIDAGLEPAGDLAVRTRTGTAQLPLHTPSLAMLANRKDEDGIWGDWSRHLLAHPELITEEIPLRLIMLELTDGLALLGLDAEITVEYGLWLKNWSNGGVLPIPYTNGMIGYVVTADQVREGGYEPDDSYPYVYRSGRFTTRTEEIVRSAIMSLLTERTTA